VLSGNARGSDKTVARGINTVSGLHAKVSGDFLWVLFFPNFLMKMQGNQYEFCHDA